MARLSRASVFCLALAVLLQLVAYYDLPLAPWAAAQCINALSPFRSRSALAQALEASSWAHWEAGRHGQRFAPNEVDELRIGEVPASRSRPFIVRGLLNGSGSDMVGRYDWLVESPVGDLVIDYFSNASRLDGLVPDARGTLRDVVTAILDGGPQKLGTERVFRSYPNLLHQLDVAERAGPLLGGAAHIAPARIGLLLTVPIFLATGAPLARTDLHCEPIGNLVLNLAGRKTWTLVGGGRFCWPLRSRRPTPRFCPDDGGRPTVGRCRRRRAGSCGRPSHPTAAPTSRADSPSRTRPRASRTCAAGPWRRAPVTSFGCQPGRGTASTTPRASRR